MSDGARCHYCRKAHCVCESDDSDESVIDRTIDNLPTKPDFSEAKQLVDDFGFDHGLLVGAITAALEYAKESGRREILRGENVPYSSEYYWLRFSYENQPEDFCNACREYIEIARKNR